MNNLRAILLAGRAVTGWLAGRRTETEARAMVNEARAMIGQPPIAPEPPVGSGPRGGSGRHVRPSLGWYLRNPVTGLLSLAGHWEYEHPFKTCPSGERHCPHGHWKPGKG